MANRGVQTSVGIGLGALALGVLATVAMFWERSAREALSPALATVGQRAVPSSTSPFGPGSDARAADWQGVPAPSAPQWQVAPGYDIEHVTSGLTYPTRLAAVPDPGPDADAPVLYIAELPGTVRYLTRDGALQTLVTGLKDFASEAHPNSDQTGLSGLALLEDGSLVATTTALHQASGLLRNQIWHLVLADGGRSVAQKRLLLEPEEFTSAIHQIHAVVPRGDQLLVSVGDADHHALASDPDAWAGKLICLTLDGEPCPDNPDAQAAPTSARPFVWASGLRNIYDFDLHPGSGDVYAADNGPNLDRFLQVRPGVDHGWNGDWASMRLHAAFTWGPPANPVPVGLRFDDHGVLDDASPPALFLGMFGNYGAQLAGAGKTIQVLRPDPQTGTLPTVPETVVRHVGNSRATVHALEFGVDGLYFTDFFGAIGEAAPPDAAHGKGNVWRLVRSDATAGQVAGTPGETPVERGRVHFLQRCAGCHATRPGIEREGPGLAKVAARKVRELNSPAYEALLAELASSDQQFLVEQRPRYQAVLAESGADRARVWFDLHITEPRFDKPLAHMPGFPDLSQNERADLVAYLMTLR